MPILVQDSFNRANTTSAIGLGVADSGQTWEHAGASKIYINNNLAQGVGGSDNYAVLNVDVSDVSMQVKIITWHPWNRIVFRYTDINNYLYFDADGIKKRAGGVNTTIATHGATISNGNTIKITVEGNMVKAFVNGVEKLALTETFNQISTKFGFSTASTAAQYDDFLVESITSSGTAHTKSLSDSVSTSESFSKQFSAMVIDSIATGESESERTTKSFSDTVLSADSIAYTQGKAVSLSDSIAISEAISKALTKWQTDGISTGDSDSGATSKQLADAIMQTDVITAFGGKSVILTEGITVSDSAVKAVGRLRSDGLGLADALGKQSSVRLYDVVISTDAVSTYLPNAPEYRHVMRFPVRLNTRQTVNVTITQRKRFDLDI